LRRRLGIPPFYRAEKFFPFFSVTGAHERRPSLIYKVDHFAAFSFEFQYLMVNATDADEWNDKEIDNDPQKDYTKGSQYTHPIPRLNDSMGPKVAIKNPISDI
jgi:hypothetical protein